MNAQNFTRLATATSIVVVVAACSADDSTDGGSGHETDVSDATTITADASGDVATGGGSATPGDSATTGDAAGGCARFGFIASGTSCGTGCSLSCPCTPFPKSVASCTSDGCIVAASCNEVCAADLSEALACTGTHTIAARDAGTDGDGAPSCPRGGFDCSAQQAGCGTVIDGCGDRIGCGSCANCGAGGNPNTCYCSAANKAGPHRATGVVEDTSGQARWTGTTTLLAGPNYGDAYVVQDDGGLGLVKGQTSDALTFSGFQFAVPDSATIAGIRVYTDRTAFDDGPTDASVRLVKGGFAVGTNHALTADWKSNPFGDDGGPNDLWGTSWSAADVNSAAFGVSLSVTYPASADAGSPPSPDLYAAVTDVWMEVSYTLVCPDR
jgi:hypothetical protein